MFERFTKKSVVPDPDSALPGRAEALVVPEAHFVNGNPLVAPFPEGLEPAAFGMGCFWGAERKFWQLSGVVSTAVGYAAGHTPNPTYEEVCSGRTGHNEVVRVVFDPGVISFGELLTILAQFIPGLFLLEMAASFLPHILVSGFIVSAFLALYDRKSAGAGAARCRCSRSRRAGRPRPEPRAGGHTGRRRALRRHHRAVPVPHGDFDCGDGDVCIPSPRGTHDGVGAARADVAVDHDPSWSRGDEDHRCGLVAVGIGDRALRALAETVAGSVVKSRARSGLAREQFEDALLPGPRRSRSHWSAIEGHDGAGTA